MLRKRWLKVGISFALVLSIFASLACFSASAAAVRSDTVAISQGLAVSPLTIGDTKTVTETYSGVFGATQYTIDAQAAEIKKDYNPSISYNDGTYKGTLYLTSFTYYDSGLLTAFSPLDTCYFTITYSGTVTAYA